ncbi:MAG: hypothetical protein JRN15_00950 [Nitrososphaerota archaeon]|nr:hypothetical protein [Nitrososphaerota archaeon]
MVHQEVTNLGSTLDFRDVQRFRIAIAERLGLQFEDAKLGFLAEIFERRIKATNLLSIDYISYLERDRNMDEVGVLASELTVPETYFFRNIEQFNAFTFRVLPERTKVRRPGEEIRILSAGCASGEEAYSLAICLQENLEPNRKVSVTAIDVNPLILDRARQARFSPWSLREVPLAQQKRWFNQDGRYIYLNDRIREAVQFKQYNLVDNNQDLWKAETYDLIFCRNVMMYFTPENMYSLVDRITLALAPGGFLFLGHAETLRGISQNFHLCHSHDTFYYQRKEEIDTSRSELVGAAGTGYPTILASQSPNFTSLLDGAQSWVQAITVATEHVQKLTETISNPQVGIPQESPSEVLSSATSSKAEPERSLPMIGERGDVSSSIHWDLKQALDLLGEENYGRALDFVQALPPNAAVDPDVVLLRAVLLTNVGDLEKAEEVCNNLLEFDEFNAGAHYLLALCKEGMGDLAGAIEHDTVSAYLDPLFAMPHLHLGLVARRKKDYEKMRSEFSQAAGLLEHEDISRLILYGGGFGRDTLITLCKSGVVLDGGIE